MRYVQKRKMALAQVLDSRLVESFSITAIRRAPRLAMATTTSDWLSVSNFLLILRI